MSPAMNRTFIDWKSWVFDVGVASECCVLARHVCWRSKASGCAFVLDRSQRFSFPPSPDAVAAMSSLPSTLCDLKPGECGRILEVQGADAIASRLLEMGMLPGEVVSLVGRAPLGDPAEYTVLGYRISLRNIESTRVRIEKLP